MSLDSIAIEGYKSFRSETRIALSRSFNAVIGLNGLGKSVVLEAIAFCLGGGAGRGSLQDAINHETRRELGPVACAAVTLRFTCEDGISVGICRTVAGSGASTYRLQSSNAAADAGGGDEPASGWKKVPRGELKTILMRMLSLDIDALHGTIVMQNKAAVRTEPSALLAQIEEMLGTSGAASKIKGHREAAEAAEADAAAHETELEAHVSDLDALAPQLRAWDAFRRQRAEFTADQRTFFGQQIAALGTAFQQADHRATTAEDDANRAAALRDALETTCRSERARADAAAAAEGVIAAAASRAASDAKATRAVEVRARAKATRARDASREAHAAAARAQARLMELAASEADLSAESRRLSARVQSIESGDDSGRDRGHSGPPGATRVTSAAVAAGRAVATAAAELATAEAAEAAAASRVADLGAKRAAARRAADTAAATLSTARSLLSSLSSRVAATGAELTAMAALAVTEGVEPSAQGGVGRVARYDRAIWGWLHHKQQSTRRRQGAPQAALSSPPLVARLHSLATVPAAAAVALAAVLAECTSLTTSFVVRDRGWATAVLDAITAAKVGPATCIILAEQRPPRGATAAAASWLAAGPGDGSTPLALCFELPAATTTPLNLTPVEVNQLRGLLESFTADWHLVADRDAAARARRASPSGSRANFVTRAGELFKADGEVVAGRGDSGAVACAIVSTFQPPVHATTARGAIDGDHEMSDGHAPSSVRDRMVALKSQLVALTADIVSQTATVTTAAQRSEAATAAADGAGWVDDSSTEGRGVTARVAAARLALAAAQAAAAAIAATAPPPPSRKRAANTVLADARADAAAAAAQHARVVRLLASLQAVAAAPPATTVGRSHQAMIKAADAAVAAAAAEAVAAEGRAAAAKASLMGRGGLRAASASAGRDAALAEAAADDAASAAMAAASEAAESRAVAQRLTQQIEASKLAASAFHAETAEEATAIAAARAAGASPKPVGAPPSPDHDDDDERMPLRGRKAPRHRRRQNSDDDNGDDAPPSLESVEAVERTLAVRGATLARARSALDPGAPARAVDASDGASIARAKVDSARATAATERRLHFAAEADRYAAFAAGVASAGSHLTRIYGLLTGGVGDALISYAPEAALLASEGVTLSVRPDRRGWRPLAQLSGGQQALVALALSFALQEAHGGSSFYCFDEIDASLDAAKASAVADYLSSDRRSPQWIVVSHRPEIFTRADAIIGVFAKPDGSTAALTCAMTDS